MLPTIAREADAVVMIDQRKLPAQEIYVRCTGELYTRRVDEPATKNATGQGYVVVPPYRAPHHSCIRSQPDFGLSQRHVRLLYYRVGAAHSDENACYRRVFTAGGRPRRGR